MTSELKSTRHVHVEAQVNLGHNMIPGETSETFDSEAAGKTVRRSAHSVHPWQA